MVVAGARTVSSNSRKLAPEHSLAGVDLAAANLDRGRLGLAGVPEDRERADVLRVPAVGYPRDGIVLPVEVAGLDGRLEAGEDLDVRELASLVGALARRRGVALVRLNLKKKYVLFSSITL